MDQDTVSTRENEPPSQEEPARDLDKRPDWSTPRMEDVSEQVTAQPYIRFT